MGKKYTVLIVDDDKFVLDMYRKKFEHDGALVDIAVGPEEVLAKLHDGAKPDILILDVIMPTMNGIELLGVIRKEKLIPNAAVVLLTNEGDRKKIEEAKALGIRGYIQKATTLPTEIVEKVKEIVNLKTE